MPEMRKMVPNNRRNPKNAPRQPKKKDEEFKLTVAAYLGPQRNTQTAKRTQQKNQPTPKRTKQTMNGNKVTKKRTKQAMG